MFKNNRQQSTATARPLSALIVLALAAGVLLPSAMATPIGTISFGITPGGGATGSATLIDWYLPFGGGVGDFTTGGGSVTYTGGTITALTNPYGQLKDLTVAALAGLPGTPLTNFIQFYSSASLPAPPGTGATLPFPVWDVLGVGPPSAADCAVVGSTPNIPCSIHVTAGTPYTSPLVLTLNGNSNGTDVRLDFTLLGRDSGGSNIWTGLATANVPGMTPAQIGAAINAGQTVNVQSWSLAITSVPEPGTFGLIGAALLLVGIGGKRKRAV